MGPEPLPDDRALRPTADVCVIGAGPAGIAAGVELTRAGVDWVGFEQRPGPGGVWSTHDSPGLTHAWASLSLNSPRGWFELRDHPMPRSYPDFPSAAQVGSYLEGAVDHFGIRDRIGFGTTVTRVVPVGDGSWHVTLGTGEARRFAAVVVANGHHDAPRLPEVPGHFAGGQQHSRDYHFGSALPTVTSVLPGLVERGRVRIRPQVARLAGHVVEFVDGSSEQVDEIIHCTGFRTTTPFLDAAVFSAEDNRVRLHHRVFHPDHPSLYFVGLLQAVGWGFLPLFESQARLVAAHLTGEYALPDAAAMRASIAREQERIRRRFVDSPRNRYQMNGAVYRHECRVELRRGARRARTPSAAGGSRPVTT